MYTRPDDVLGEWVRGINEKEIDSVLELYDVHSIIVPTFLSRLLNTQNEITTYFEQLLSRQTLSVSLRSDTIETQVLGASIFVLSGVYDFQIDREGVIHSTEARFTFVIDTSKPRPIQHHHSSQLPWSFA